MSETITQKLLRMADQCERDAKRCADKNDEYGHAWSSGAMFAYRDSVYELKIAHPQFALLDQHKGEPECNQET